MKNAIKQTYRLDPAYALTNPYIASLKETFEQEYKNIIVNGSIIKWESILANLYVSKKLGISIESYDNHDGKVIWADNFAKDVLENDKILKLVYNDSANYLFSSMNWSYSKGDTVDTACVILTDKFDAISTNTFSVKGISSSTINKLYVAMTRSRGDLKITDTQTFKCKSSRQSKSAYCNNAQTCFFVFFII